MKFLWPEALFAYLLIPAVVGAYVAAMRGRAKASVVYPTLDLARAAASAGRPWRRHIPAAAYLLTLCAIIFAVARPVWPIPVPDNQAAVMLSIDVSGSMIATDVWPSRMEAAKQVATDFVRRLPAGAKVGLVKFSTHATLIAPPTEDHERVVQAIAALHPEASTAIGDGLLKAVYALPGRTRRDPGAAADPPADPAKIPPAAVVLMSDGGNNAGTPPDQAAAAAREQHVTVHTVGLGRPDASSPDSATGPGGEALDEQTLKMIAAMTGGMYHRASTAGELSNIYNHLGRMVAWTLRPEEVGGLVSGASAAVLGGTLILGMLWRRLD
jgi:Ca-activated chloride channel family protein